MEQVLEQGYADLISMSRPFIREPFLVKHIREGKTDAAECESCNLCLAAQVNDMAVRCYCKGFPDS
jgi:2,4-dienoyl-CoA reductase-like NADH-dependent reductase (Old Yellow Enzyme family)